MHPFGIASLAILLTPATLAAQQNPFALTGGSVKSAHIVYDIHAKGKPVPQSGVEMGISDQRSAVRMHLYMEFEGEKGIMKILVVENRDSVYKLTDDEGEVAPSLRQFLSKEFEALDRAGKERVLANLKLTGQLDADEITPAFRGKKIGTETVAGHRCDVYQAGKETACVLPDAPSIPLKATDEQGLTWVAKKVSLNRPLPATLTTLPKGIRWKKERDFESGDLALEIWNMKKEGADPQEAGSAAVARFAVRYLASPQAAAELRQRAAGTTPEPEETGDVSAEEDTAQQE